MTDDLSTRFPGAAKSPAYFRPLSAQEEFQFKRWYENYSRHAGLAPDPDDPLHAYNYRAWYLAQKANPEKFRASIDPKDNRLHSPSLFKRFDHPNRYVPDETTGALIDSIMTYD